MGELPFREEAGGVLLHVRLTPKAGHDCIDGVTLDADARASLQVRVRAVPENGAANAALIRLVARELDVRKSDVMVVSGASSRYKTVRVAGDSQALVSRLMRYASGAGAGADS